MEPHRWPNWPVLRDFSQKLREMKYEDVCIESFGYTLPEEVWSSELIEKKLEPLYSRLKLPQGRLELMTGIAERRFWAPGVPPSQNSIISCNRAIEAAAFSRSDIGCLIHGSVCRDFLEPATACTVHNKLDLPSECLIYDVSNACLGLLNGMLQAANMIQLQQISSALVVGSEGGRQLVETTIDALNRDTSLTRKSVKPAFASLTIGSASCAILLTHRSISSTQNRLSSAAATANTQFNDLCQSHQDQAGSEMAPLMQTDSELLMSKGIETGIANMKRFLKTSDWKTDEIDKTVCHQVGSTHRKLMLESLDLPMAQDFATFSWLGNTGAVALPVSLAIAAETGHLHTNDRLAMLGIGSGINCVMIGAEWQKSIVGADPSLPTNLVAASPHSQA